MNTELRVAIVGCGRMGLQHARSAAALGHKVAFACDPDVARVTALAANHRGCEVLADAAQLPWAQIDAVFVCTPPFARGPVELAAARAGVGVFLEKPIGLSVQQLLPALAAARESGAVTSVGYMNRYRASVRRVRALVQDGPVLGFAGHWVGAAYKVPWWGDPALSGGQLNEQCTHLVDLARHLAGEVTEVSAFAQPAPEGMRGNASVSMLLRFGSGALGTILCGCLAQEKQIGCRVFTPRGQLALDGWDFRDGKEAGTAEDVFLAEAKAFLDAVAARDRAGVLCDLEEAMRTQRVVDALQAAVAAGGNHVVECG